MPWLRASLDRDNPARTALLTERQTGKCPEKRGERQARVTDSRRPKFRTQERNP